VQRVKKGDTPVEKTQIRKGGRRLAITQRQARETEVEKEKWGNGYSVVCGQPSEVMTNWGASVVPCTGGSEVKASNEEKKKIENNQASQDGKKVRQGVIEGVVPPKGEKGKMKRPGVRCRRGVRETRIKRNRKEEPMVGGKED